MVGMLNTKTTTSGHSRSFLTVDPVADVVGVVHRARPTDPPPPARDPRTHERQPITIPNTKRQRQRQDEQAYPGPTTSSVNYLTIRSTGSLPSRVRS
jgi:hypothetical protein